MIKRFLFLVTAILVVTLTGCAKDEELKIINDENKDSVSDNNSVAELKLEVQELKLENQKLQNQIDKLRNDNQVNNGNDIYEQEVEADQKDGRVNLNDGVAIVNRINFVEQGTLAKKGDVWFLQSDDPKQTNAFELTILDSCSVNSVGIKKASCLDKINDSSMDLDGAFVRVVGETNQKFQVNVYALTVMQ